MIGIGKPVIKVTSFVSKNLIILIFTVMAMGILNSISDQHHLSFLLKLSTLFELFLLF